MSEMWSSLNQSSFYAVSDWKMIGSVPYTLQKQTGKKEHNERKNEIRKKKIERKKKGEKNDTESE